MEMYISQAAQSMRYGNHREADRVLRELETNCTNEAVIQCALHTLQTTPAAPAHAPRDHASSPAPASTGELEGVYVHFIALKLLRSAVLRARGAAGESSQLVTMLLHYTHHILGESVLHSHWRPVVSELCTTIATLLKWRCVNEMMSRTHSDTQNGESHNDSSNNNSSNNNISHSYISGSNARNSASSIACSSSFPDSFDTSDADARIVLNSAMSIVNLLEHHSPTPATRLLHRMLVESVVIEFGLYTTAAQQRGLTISQHRHSRRVFEVASALPRMVHAVLHSMLDSDPTQETPDTMQAGWAALVTTLSWGSHDYFMEQELSEEEACVCFSVNRDPYWDELLLHGIVLRSTHPIVQGRNGNISRVGISNCGSSGYSAAGVAAAGNAHTSSGLDGSGGNPHTATTVRLSLFELLLLWCLQCWGGGHAAVGSSMCTVGDDGQRAMEALQLLCCFRGEQWGSPEVSYFVCAALNTCVSLLECRLTAMMSTVQSGALTATTTTTTQGDALPLLAGAVRRLVNRYAEDMTSMTAVQPLLLRLSAVTEHVIRWSAAPHRWGDAATRTPPTPESVRIAWHGNGMACLDELLHAWYSLVTAQGTDAPVAAHTCPGSHGALCECDPRCAVLAQCCASIFATYVHCRGSVATALQTVGLPPRVAGSNPTATSNHNNHSSHDDNDSNDGKFYHCNANAAHDDDTSDGDEDDYSESLTLAQLHLMARLGRCAAVSSCAVLHQCVCQLGEALWQRASVRTADTASAVMTGAVRGEGGTPRLTQLNDPLWFVWTLVASFIADPSEGEQASIPVCFLHAAGQCGTSSSDSLAERKGTLSVAVPGCESGPVRMSGGDSSSNSENANPSIPCQSTHGAGGADKPTTTGVCAGAEALVQLMHSVLHFTPLLVDCMTALAGRTDAVMSPAVVSSYIDVLRRYVGTYMEAAAASSCPASTLVEEWANRVYARAFDGGTAVMHAALTMSVHTLQHMPYDAEATQAVCELLDTVTGCSAAVWGYVAQHASTSVLWQLARTPHGVGRQQTAEAAHGALAGHIRGRLVAFLLTCCLPPASALPSPSSAPLITETLETFIHCPARSSCHAVGELREVLDGVEGLCSSARHRAEVIYIACPILTRRAHHTWLPMCRTAFHDRHLALALLRAVRALWVSCASFSPPVAEPALTELVYLVAQTMRWATTSVSSWSSAAARHRADGGGRAMSADEDSVTELLMATANLLRAVCQWKRMDCVWSEDDYDRHMHYCMMHTERGHLRSSTASATVTSLDSSCCADVNYSMGVNDRDASSDGGDTRLVVLAQCHVDALVALVSAIDAEQLHLPRLVAALLAALEDTVTAFPTMCVAHPSLRTLVSVMFYATQSSSAQMQCAGMETCVQVVEYMATQIQQHTQQQHQQHHRSCTSDPDDGMNSRGTPSAVGSKGGAEGAAVARYHALCAELLQLVLRCLVSSRFNLGSARTVARVVWTVSRAAAAAGEELSAIFVGVAEELPRAAPNMEELYTTLSNMLASGGACREVDALSHLERLLGDHMASLRGIDVV